MEETRIALQNLRLSGMAEKWVSLFETRQVDRLSLSDGLQLLLHGKTGADWDSAPEEAGTLLTMQS